jgi:hypothetical protein
MIIYNIDKYIWLRGERTGGMRGKYGKNDIAC